ncbi:hypothetical protein BJ875DRAFT_516012 [Amylocarpus encephaloides]|uniref:Uncharacterized protein n=1 Tax=Amylocarpus encephaloides TaxID=45428 RepID=A0A9P8C4B9_9HELO|nr:hypothetical protein BJ875DRAFT_516012 [Amylocarpus encephaloides]
MAGMFTRSREISKLVAEDDGTPLNESSEDGSDCGSKGPTQSNSKNKRNSEREWESLGISKHFHANGDAEVAFCHLLDVWIDNTKTYKKIETSTLLFQVEKKAPNSLGRISIVNPATKISEGQIYWNQGTISCVTTKSSFYLNAISPSTILKFKLACLDLIRAGYHVLTKNGAYEECYTLGGLEQRTLGITKATKASMSDAKRTRMSIVIGDIQRDVGKGTKFPAVPKEVFFAWIKAFASTPNVEIDNLSTISTLCVDPIATAKIENPSGKKKKYEPRNKNIREQEPSLSSSWSASQKLPKIVSTKDLPKVKPTNLAKHTTFGDLPVSASCSRVQATPDSNSSYPETQFKSQQRRIRELKKRVKARDEKIAEINFLRQEERKGHDAVAQELHNLNIKIEEKVNARWSVEEARRQRAALSRVDRSNFALSPLLDTANDLIRKRDEELQRSRGRVDGLNRRLWEIEATLRRRDDDISKVDSDLVRKRRHLETADREYDRQKLDLKDLQIKLQNKTKELIDTQAELKQQRCRFIQTLDKLGLANSQLKAKKTDLVRREEQLEIATETIRAKEEMPQSVIRGSDEGQRQLNQATANLASKESLIKGLKSELEKLRPLLQDPNAFGQIPGLYINNNQAPPSQKIVDLTEELRRKEEELNVVTEQNMTYEIRVDGDAAEIEVLKTRTEELEPSTEKLKKDLKKVKKQLKNALVLVHSLGNGDSNESDSGAKHDREEDKENYTRNAKKIKQENSREIVEVE